MSSSAKRKPVKVKPSVAKTLRRAETARKLAEGKSVKQIAKEGKVSRATAHRDATSKEARYLIAAALDRRRQDLEKLLDKSLARISEALDAKRLVILSQGNGEQKIVEIEDEAMAADNPTRIKAVGALQRYFILGRPSPRRDSHDEPITLEQFEALLQTYLNKKLV